MNKSKIIYQVGAFTTEPFKVNDNRKIRFYTPESEIDLCGHATLSASHILYETGTVGNDDQITFSSKTGKKDSISHQVTKRTGVLKVSLKKGRVEIAGQAQTIFKVELFV
jgi:PhzF family phenazine biosynthesis protein